MPGLALIAPMIVAILALVALIALVALVALAALARALVSVPYMLSRAISRRWHIRSGTSPRAAAALSPARHPDESVWQGAALPPPALSVGRDPQAPQHSFRTSA
jgi:hypothetical protein